MPMPMMQMYFNFRQSEFLLFHEWLPETLAGYLISLLAVFVIAAFYEALRIARALLFRWAEHNPNVLQQQQHSCAPSGDVVGTTGDGFQQVPSTVVSSSTQQHFDSSTNQSSSSCECIGASAVVARELSYRANPKILAPFTSLFAGPHLLQSVLHFLQFLISFSLMLLAMTYNVPVFVALLIGHIVGYFLAAPLNQNGLAEERRVGGECCCS